jgi:hypothetical protein
MPTDGYTRPLIRKSLRSLRINGSPEGVTAGSLRDQRITPAFHNPPEDGGTVKSRGPVTTHFKRL